MEVHLGSHGERANSSGSGEKLDVISVEGLQNQTCSFSLNISSLFLEFLASAFIIS